MNVIVDNLWEFHKDKRYWCGITTNPIINSRGECVMGRGVALEAKRLYPDLPILLANRIRQHGNRVFLIPQYRLFTFPVKWHWNQAADLKLIKRSAEQLHELIITIGFDYKFVLPKPGTGNGRLNWLDVEPMLVSLKDLPNLLVVTKE